jgi:ribonuclease Y
MGVIAFFKFKKRVVQENLNIEEEQKRLIDEARIKAASLLKEAKLEAKSRLLEMKSDFDSETEETRSDLKKEERRLSKKSEKLDSQEEQ